MTVRILARRQRAITDENSRWWTLGAMCFALFMVMLDNTVVNVALPSIQRDLRASLSSLEWTVSAYTLTFAVLVITGGRLGDIFGRRRMFLFGTVVFGLSSLALGFAPATAVLASFRALQGAGAAFMMPATLSIITRAFPPGQRGTAIGTWAGVSAVALAIGPVIGGVLTQSAGWRAIFFINPPIAVAAVAVTLYAVRESRDETAGRTSDVPGIVSLTVGLTALVLALIEGNNWHWGSARIISLLALALLALLAFVAVELRVSAPMLDFGFFRSRTMIGVNLISFSATFAMSSQLFFIALYMQNLLHYSPLGAGLRFLPSTVVLVVMGPIAGRLTDRVGPRPLMTLGLLVLGGALLLQARVSVHSGYGVLLPGLVLMGLGIGLVMSPMSTAAMNAAGRSKAGAASGVLSMSRMVGGTFGVAVVGALITATGRGKLDQSLPHLPASTRAMLANSLGGGGTTSGLHLPAAVTSPLERAFVSGLTTGLQAGAAVAFCAATLAWLFVERKSSRHKAMVPGAEPNAAGETTTSDAASAPVTA